MDLVGGVRGGESEGGRWTDGHQPPSSVWFRDEIIVLLLLACFRDGADA